jgi:hypothetical protein
MSMSKKSKFERRCCMALVVAFLVCVFPAQSSGELMAGNIIKKGCLTVYYLSPRVLTRTRMLPERLKQDSYRLQKKNLPLSHIMSIFEKVRTTEHKNAKENKFSFDFRLCISSFEASIWFSADGKYGYENGVTFLLSEKEEDELLGLFKELDTMIDQDHMPTK